MIYKFKFILKANMFLIFINNVLLYSINYYFMCNNNKDSKQLYVSNKFYIYMSLINYLNNIGILKLLKVKQYDLNKMKKWNKNVKNTW